MREHLIQEALIERRILVSDLPLTHHAAAHHTWPDLAAHHAAAHHAAIHHARSHHRAILAAPVRIWPERRPERAEDQRRQNQGQAGDTHPSIFHGVHLAAPCSVSLAWRYSSRLISPSA